MRHLVWSPTFRRKISQLEEGQLIFLLNILSEVYIPEEASDGRIWTGIFYGSVASFLSLWAQRSTVVQIMTHEGSLKSCCVLLDSIARWCFMSDNLRKPRKIVVDAYSPGLSGEDTADHLFLNCRVVLLLWNSMLS